MSSSELNSFRDEFWHEDLELYLQLCSDMESDVANYALKSVTVPSDLASNGTIQQRALVAKVAFEALAGSIAKELSNLAKVRNRFFESFTKSVKVEHNRASPLELKEASVAQLSEAECKRALLIAARTIEYSRRITDVGLNQAAMYLKLSEHRLNEICEWDPKASELAREVDRLHTEAKAQEQQVKKVTDSLTNCSKRLNALVSTSQKAAKGKSRAQVASLEDSLTAVEKLFKAEREKVIMLEGQLAEADKQLEATRASLVESTAETADLRIQLGVATRNGQTHATRAEELEEKLRCSICMDRPKNVVFACGHTCCDGCASEWKQCPNKCEGPKSHKPVKHTFRLYL